MTFLVGSAQQVLFFSYSHSLVVFVVSVATQDYFQLCGICSQGKGREGGGHNL